MAKNDRDSNSAELGAFLDDFFVFDENVFASFRMGLRKFTGIVICAPQLETIEVHFVRHIL